MNRYTMGADIYGTSIEYENTSDGVGITITLEMPDADGEVT
jgi:hypothetical protein